MGSASSNSGVCPVFSVHHGVVRRTSSLYCWGVYKKWWVASSNTACISHLLCTWLTGDCWPPVIFFSGITWKQRFTNTRQEVVANTPEMILKVMDNYWERLHQCINIQGRHLSDVLFKTRWCKTAFCVLSRNKKKTFAVSSLVSNLLASQIGEFFLPHPVLLRQWVIGWSDAPQK